MMRTMVGLFAITLAACGGTGGGSAGGFVGEWTGQLTSPAAPCSDGTSIKADSATVTATVTGNATGLVWKATCGDITLKVNGNTAAQVGTRTCAPTVKNGTQVTRTIKSMTLILEGSALKVAFAVDVAVAFSGKTGTCKGTVAGTLVKK